MNVEPARPIAVTCPLSDAIPDVKAAGPPSALKPRLSPMQVTGRPVIVAAPVDDPFAVTEIVNRASIQG